MAQINPRRFSITTFSGMSAGEWAPVTAPAGMFKCHRIVIQNVDPNNDISVCTDPDDANAVNSYVTAAADGGEFEIQLNEQLAGLGPGEQICYIQGAGAQPVIYAYE
jgi:hypothetical protein